MEQGGRRESSRTWHGCPLPLESISTLCHFHCSIFACTHQQNGLMSFPFFRVRNNPCHRARRNCSPCFRPTPSQRNYCLPPPPNLLYYSFLTPQHRKVLSYTLSG